VELKREQPHRTVHVLNKILRREFGRTLPPSTLYRHLRCEGATRIKLGVAKPKIRCRWTRQHSHALWLGDFEHGPPVLHEGRPYETHLSAWIDCHSRFIVEARYYLRENLDILLDSLLRAWGSHGASQELYLDNAKIYHAQALRLACAELTIRLRHRPPREPAPGGLIERFFQTLQGQFEAEVQASRLLTLAELNQALQAWLRTDYHQTIHSETRETPELRFQQGLLPRRHVDLQAVGRFFRQTVRRTVDTVHSDVTLEGHFFAVDAKLRGDHVLARYDAFLRPGDLQEVELFSLDGRYLGVGRRYQRQKGFHPQPAPEQKNKPPVEPRYIQTLLADQQAQLETERQAGIDYHSARRHNRWSFSSWANAFARLLGRTGGLSSFSADELTALRQFHERHERLNEGLLRKAFAAAPSLTIPQILLQLQQLLSEGRKN
jgi:transposase InsO family protein